VKTKARRAVPPHLRYCRPIQRGIDKSLYLKITAVMKKPKPREIGSTDWIFMSSILFRVQRDRSMSGVHK
jgi:hypothetical protein